ncbi:hypothetical protein CBR_g74665 [Chara braunii]|uniref:Uncharacterized protein n=1 Tax=Chara braunii TaxID=69332 RepID=A0A388KAD1_CHABU|nr:hypothetical protein CBR_g74665 [Chara braunii]|eukprot:GBG66979.1 hypothetical protein CBR_g74665 [Chara braunii]
MKAFDVRGNGTEFQMLDPEKFLSKTNGYRVTGSLPVVDSAFMLSRPLVQFNSPTDQLAAFVTRYREEFARLPAAKRVDCVFVPIDAGPKRCQDQPARAGEKRKQLANAPSSSAAVVEARPLRFRPRIGKVAMRPSSPARPQTTTTELCAIGLVPSIVPGEVQVPLMTTNARAEMGRAVVGKGTAVVRRGRAVVRRRRAVVRGMTVMKEMLKSAITGSISADLGVWDRPELVLALVDPNVIVGEQGRRITPDEFFQRDSAEFDWYAVCGQHTAEAMKRLVVKDSPAVKVYGLRTYSKVRVVFFDDDHTSGCFNVSLFDNTRENRAMMLSFQQAMRDMRQWWINNNRIEAPKAKVSEKDVVAVAHQKTWQNFLRACMRKACDKAFVKQALDNEYSKDWSNKLRGYLNLATSTRTVWPLMEKFFAMSEEGKLPIGNSKIPLEMSGRMEGRLPGPYTDENKGQRTLYHCIYARDGPKGSTVSWKDLCPTYFKNFGDMTCREREVALLLLMSRKVVATSVRVTPPRVNTECLLDIMRKERYMVCMFNYVVFCAEGRAGDEWNDDFFMSYKDLEERYASNRLCADEWEKELEKLHSNLVKTIPRRLGGVDEARQGAGLGPTEVMYKEAPFHFKVFIYTAIDKLDMLRAEVKRIASSACHLVWDKLGRQTTLLPVCMRSKEVMAASVDIIAAAQKMACRAVIVDISAANFRSAWTSQDFDALYAMMAKCCGGEWKMAVTYVSKGWRPFPRMGKDSWLKTTEQSILYRCQKENLGESESSIAAKAKQLFDALGATRQLEYSHKFYELQSSPSYGKIDWKAATRNTMGEQREDGETTLGVKPPLPEAGNTPAGKNTIRAISVATGDTSQGEKVSLNKSADAGATYGNLLATGAALADTSEMESESTAGMGVTGMSLHPPTCTSKGDAHCTTTPQGGVTGDDGNGGNAGGAPRSRNIEDMTTDDEDGVEGGKGVSDLMLADNEG